MNTVWLVETFDPDGHPQEAHVVADDALDRRLAERTEFTQTHPGWSVAAKPVT